MHMAGHLTARLNLELPGIGVHFDFATLSTKLPTIGSAAYADPVKRIPPSSTSAGARFMVRSPWIVVAFDSCPNWSSPAGSRPEHVRADKRQRGSRCSALERGS